MILPTNAWESGRGQPHSKTLRPVDAFRIARQRLGVRLPSAALAITDASRVDKRRGLQFVELMLLFFWSFDSPYIVSYDFADS